jgi:hypothetical protein
VSPRPPVRGAPGRRALLRGRERRKGAGGTALSRALEAGVRAAGRPGDGAAEAGPQGGARPHQRGHLFGGDPGPRRPRRGGPGQDRGRGAGALARGGVRVRPGLRSQGPSCARAGRSDRFGSQRARSPGR